VKRKHANITLIALLSLFSITIVGWIAAMAWAIWEVRSGRVCEAVREDATELPPATVMEG
jgi:hypothetical protein